MTDIGKRRGATFATLVALIALATLAAALAGCAVGPNCVKPATPVAPQFAGTTQGAYSAEETQAKFWTQSRHEGETTRDEASCGRPVPARNATFVTPRSSVARTLTVTRAPLATSGSI